MQSTEKLNQYFQMENRANVLEDVINQMNGAPEEITQVTEDEVQNIVGLVNRNIVEGEFEETDALDDGLLGADQSLEVMKDSLIEKHEEMQTEAANFFTRFFDTLTDQFKDIWSQNEQRLKRLKEVRVHVEKFEGDTLTFNNKDLSMFYLGNKPELTKVTDNIGQLVDMVKKNDVAKMYLDGIRLMGKYATMGQDKDADKFVETIRRNSVYKVPSIFGNRNVEPNLNIELYTAKVSNAVQVNLTLPLPFSSSMPEVALNSVAIPVQRNGEVKLSKKEVLTTLDKLINIVSNVPTKNDFQRTRQLIISGLEAMGGEKVDLKSLDDNTRTLSDNRKKAMKVTGVLTLSILALAYFQMKPPRKLKSQAITYGGVVLGQLINTLSGISKNDSYERDLTVNGDLDITSSQNPVIQMFLTKVMNSLSSRTTALVIRHHIAVQQMLNILTKQLPIAVYRAK